MPKAEWLEQAAFMREVGALHAEWTGWDVDTLRLTKLVLGPPPTPVGARPAEPRPSGVAAKLLKQHEIMFAATTHKPPFVAPPAPEAVVPRAVRAKREAAAHGAKKAQKRGT